MRELPLVSFCMTCHNQAAYIRQALVSVLEQTYPNVEVVISDDASTDESPALIRELVQNLSEKYPQRKIVSNFNDVNLGNIGNFEKCFSLANGEIFIEADGDDISLPERAAEIVAAWERSKRKATLFVHQWIVFDEEHEYAPMRLRSVTADIKGAAMAVSRKVYDDYKRVEKKGAGQDLVWTYRALRLGAGVLIQKPLIRYRLGGVSSLKPHAKAHINIARFTLDACEQLFIDIGEDLGIRNIHKWASGHLQLLEGKTIYDRMKGFYHVHGCKPTRSFFCDAAYILPRQVGWKIGTLLEDVLYPHKLHGKIVK